MKKLMLVHPTAKCRRFWHWHSIERVTDRLARVTCKRRGICWIVEWIDDVRF